MYGVLLSLPDYYIRPPCSGPYTALVTGPDLTALTVFSRRCKSCHQNAQASLTQKKNSPKVKKTVSSSNYLEKQRSAYENGLSGL
jgi:cytochrome c553